MNQYVDPSVSIAKFETEVAAFHSFEDDYRKRGWFLLKAIYPEILIVLVARKPVPPAVVGAVAFDYTNYDVEPPTVRIVDPFTLEPYQKKTLPPHLQMRRSIPGQEIEFPNGGNARLQLMQEQTLMQAHSPDDVPFLCLAGVREYHQHPGHTGDPWELHRASGAGRLIRLLEVIDTYVLQTVLGYNVALVPQVSLQIGAPPA